MKRDLNPIRNILLDIEEFPAGKIIKGFKFEGRSAAEVLEHVQLLLDADFIEGEVIQGPIGAPAACVVMRMTWSGHEFLSNAKNETIWKRVVAQAQDKGMSTSMTIINGLLEAAAKKYVGLE